MAGDIRAEAVTGSALADTAGGDIRIERVGGSLDAKTAGGDIVAPRVGGAVRAVTAGGDVRIGVASRDVKGGVTIHNSGGDVTLALPADCKADVELIVTRSRRGRAGHPLRVSGPDDLEAAGLPARHGDAERRRREDRREDDLGDDPAEEGNDLARSPRRSPDPQHRPRLELAPRPPMPDRGSCRPSKRYSRMPGPKRRQSPPKTATVPATSATLSRERLRSWSRVSGGSSKTPRRASHSKAAARRRPYQSGKCTSGLPGFPTAAAISR